VSFDFSFYATRVVEEVTAAMVDVREAMDTVRSAVSALKELRAAGPHFVQVSVSSSTYDGTVDTTLAAVDDRGRVWALRLGGDGWKPLPKHPELF
jgi:hypothetical protein